ncbi:MAG TPA: hypothetical protein VGF53_11300 [Pseudolabrys sp.]|jgi:hypothetical protein
MNAAHDDRRLRLDRSFWWFGGCLLLLMFALSIGPRVPDDQQAANCVVNVHLPGPFGITLNCDSPEFMRLAREPSGLLEPFNTRQSRPGLIAAAAVLTWALQPLASLADKLGIRASRPDIDTGRIADALAKDIPGYLAYIIINFGIVLAAFYYLQRICAPWTDSSTLQAVVLVAIGFLLAANDVVKAFMWSPHTQMFNILIPVFALDASMRANAGALIRRRFAIYIGLACGLGGTAYPLFVIVLPCVAICVFVFALRCGSRAIWWQTLCNLMIIAVFTFAPEALWFAFVWFKTGGFYQHEMTKYDEVVWILRAWHEGLGTLITIWLGKLLLLLRFAAEQAIPLAAVSVIVAALWLTNRGGEPDTRPALWPLAVTAVLVSAVAAAFYTSVGMIVPRVAYSAIPALIAVVAAAALALAARGGRRGEIVGYCCVAIALGAAAYTVLKNGPYS